MTRRAGPHRVRYGGFIDRTRRVSFRFNGHTYYGHPGDTLASALLANGIRVVGRSFKLHRPRGIFSCGMEEPNALLQLGEGAGTVPCARAPSIELTPGLVARSTAGRPGVNFDLGRSLDFVAPLWAAGFYNKTFIWPSWHAYEGIIRRLAGFGRAPSAPDPDRYETMNLHCHVLVVGGGLSGLQAALDAGRRNSDVILVEQDIKLGGRTAWEPAGPPAPSSTLHELTEHLKTLPNVRAFVRTTAVGVYDYNVVMLLQRVEHPMDDDPHERLLIVRANRIVLATGMIEQPLIFANNDRPGIVLAHSARQYLRWYGVAVGRRVLIATNNDTAYALARDLNAAEVRVLGIADTREEVPSLHRSTVQALGIPVLSDTIPIDTSGLGSLRRVTLGRLSADGQSVTATHQVKCDALAVSGGFAPALQLFSQAGGELAYDLGSGVLRPASLVPSVEIVGTASKPIPIGPRLSPVGPTHRQWVDLAHDVTVSDLELALREGYSAIEHIKRYTTVGMAVDQGKTSHAAALEIVGKLRGVPASELGHTTLRPPVTPVTLGAIAGRETGELFAPKRLLPMHAWHESNGAVFQDFGTWQRPVVYLKSGESRERAALREARAVRTACGLFDASSLGKIEVEGPDALEFLDRFYINNLKTLQPGRVRYGLMLKETGILWDDGTVVALATDHLLITTTSGNAARVHQWLEEWHQCEWPDLEVAITPVTEQWATLSLAGPKARMILSNLDTDIDFCNASFPHLGMREWRWSGSPHASAA